MEKKKKKKSKTEFYFEDAVHLTIMCYQIHENTIFAGVRPEFVDDQAIFNRLLNLE